MEFKSKNQIRKMFSANISRGHLSLITLNKFLERIELPDGVNARTQTSRRALGGFSSSNRKGETLKGRYR